MNAAAAPVDEPLRIVVIDDTADLRDLLRLALVRAGMDVVAEAGDGRAGIEAVRATRPDVVLLDLSMPVMDGLEALPHLRALVPDSTIIVLSGFDAGQMTERALASGADDYLQKGLPLTELLDRVRELGASRRPDSHPQLALAEAPAPATPAGSPVLDDALRLAPFGVLLVEPDPPYRLVWANPAASLLLDDEPEVGAPLAELAVDLADLFTRFAARDAEFKARVDARSLQLTVRPAGHRLLAYLEHQPDDGASLRRLVATAAHEIRGPVAVLNALTETYARDGGRLDGEQQVQLVSAVARQARMLDGITADLLVNAQLERGALRIEPLEVDVVAAVESLLADHQVAATVEVTRPGAAVVDPVRLHQMLGNLLRNAVRHGEPPVVVRVRAYAQDPSWVAIDVKDSGDGVPEEFVDRLFDEFARASGAAPGGMGLGLHVVRGLAEAHGGFVSYAPAPGGGAVFTLVLPGA